MSGVMDFGGGRMLELRALPPSGHAPVPIDEWLPGTEAFWSHLETECLAECCGLAAFRFTPSAIRDASAFHNVVEIAEDAEAARRFLGELPIDAVSSKRLNQTLHRLDLDALLEHIGTVV